MIALKVGPQPKSFKADRDYHDEVRYKRVTVKDKDGKETQEMQKYTVRKFHPSDKVLMEHDYAKVPGKWNGHPLRVQVKRNGIARGTTAPLPG